MFKKIIRFINEVRVELKKVTWPKGGEVINSTVVVIIVTLFIALFVGVFNRIVDELLLIIFGT
jgi:preprotein translocase subunit SecE